MSKRNKNKQHQPQHEPEVTGKMDVQVMKAPVFPSPAELYINVFISEANRGYEKPFGALFGKARCYQAKSPEEADLVVFVGGPDVDPGLYEEKAHSTYKGDIARDKRDMELYKTCSENNIPMVGVCRGAQFLHVMNGGKLIQDLDGHRGDHAMVVKNGETIGNIHYISRISSTHHQAVLQNNRMKVLGSVWNQSQTRHFNPDFTDTGRAEDIEAFFYEDTCCLGFQGHPEYADYAQYTHWCMKMIEKYIVNNKNIVLDNNRYRNKKSVVLSLPGPEEVAGEK